MRATSLAKVFAIACSLSLAPSSVAAQDRKAKPNLSAHTQAAEIAVYIDPALHADRRLHESLLAEGKQFVAERRAETDAIWRTDRDAFRLGDHRFRWSYDREYSLRHSAGPYLSVTMLHFEYTGGAHPNSYLDAFLWNREQGRRTTAAGLFREGRDNGPTLRALLVLVREAVAAEKRKRGIEVAADPAKDHWLEPLTPDWDSLGAVTLTPSTMAGRASGLTFHFSPYAVGSYAEGFYVAFLSGQVLAPFLTEQARALFAGERPAGDDLDP